MNITKNKMLALAFCIASISGYSQHNAICRLGDIKNDSLLPFIDSLKISCGTKDIKKLSKQLPSLTALSYVELDGEADETEWTNLFSALNNTPGLKAVCFNNNDFSEFPQGVKLPETLEKMIIQNNELIDYSRILDQVCSLPILKELQVDVYTIFDLPQKPDLPRQLERLIIINKDDVISEDAATIAGTGTQHTFDFFADNEKQTLVQYKSSAGMIDSDEYQELTKRFKSHYSYAFALKQYNTETADFSPSYKFVKPPVKGIDVERTVYTINAGIDNVLIYPSGTRILIPANCFRDRSGKPVTGSVRLSYREFRDPVDILVSGIPMKYDTAGEVSHFESAGMFEINASKDKAPLELVPGKKIEMNFVTTSKDSSYNFYAFNDSTGNWDYKTKPATVTKATTIEVPKSPAVATYRNLMNRRQKYRDTTKFKARFESPEFLYTVRFDPVNDRKNRIMEKRFLRSFEHNTKSLIRLYGAKKLKSGEIIFKIRSYPDAHPELSEFNSVYFVSNENLSLQEFKARYVRRKYYNDARIYQKGQQVELRLKGKGAQPFKTISADVATLDGKGKIHQLRSTAMLFRKYNRKLKKREAEFNDMVKKGKNYQDKEFEISNTNDFDLYAFNGAQSYMTRNEKAMTQAEWMTYYKQLLEKEKQALNSSAATSNNLVNSLSLDGMGIYNCDQIQRLNDPVQIFADYHSRDSAAIEPVATYIIDKKINAVLQYDGYRGFSADKIAFSNSRNAENVMLAIKADGSMAIYTADEFKSQAFRNKRRFDFRVKEVSTSFTTVAELKKYIGL
ncbi:MAG: hypothetical protein JWO09_3808 [Bacteroidetes bacterium]|nr:hypothetical protein [Bacteroidota bacterium]